MLSNGSLLLADRFLYFTPSWLLATGITLGLLTLVLVWVVLYFVHRPSAKWCWEVATEGLLLPIFITSIFVAVYTALVLTAAVFYQAPQLPYKEFAHSLQKTLSGETSIVKTIKLDPLVENLPTDEIFKGIGPYDVAEFELSIPKDASADGPQNEKRVKLMRYLPSQGGYDVLDPFQEFTSGRKIEWKRPNRRTADDTAKPTTNTAQSKYYFKGDNVQFYLTNLMNEPVEVNAKLVTTVEYDETSIIPSSMLLFLGSVLFYFLLRGFFPRVIAIAATTMKEAIYQPLYIILTLLLIVVIYLHIFIPQNTFGEDIKPFKENMLTLIMMAGSFIAIWTASHSIADEIEGRTALTVLSKPVGRIEFILGKYLGVLFPVVLLFLLCGGFFAAMIPFKVVYDGGESSKQILSWQEGFQEMRLILPALGLSFMQTMILAAISVAISTRLPMLANLLITISIYLVGNLLPLLVQSKKIADPYEIIQNLARFFATIFPVFEHFNLHTAITAGKEIPWDYMGWLMIYTLTYCSLALLVSLILFEDRDLS